MAKTKDIDLYRVMMTKGTRTPVLAIVITAGVIVVLGAAMYLCFLFFSTSIAELVAQRDELDRYVTSERTASAYQESLDYQRKAGDMAQLSGGVKSTLVALSSYPNLTQEAYARIMNLSGTEVMLSGVSYDRRTGVFAFQATSTNVMSFSAFVEALRNTGLFADIQYRGYVKAERTEISSQSTDAAGATHVTYTTIVEYSYSAQCQLIRPPAHLPEVAEGAEGAGGEGAGAGAGEGAGGAEGEGAATGAAGAGAGAEGAGAGAGEGGAAAEEAGGA
ncbi:MAG: hypothetical protein LBO07_02750 [Coriobacteriales bacterium]|jgi:hypothetical protein|nr:hypothetical protein [Coriobacteriales bacterium]